MRHTWTRWLSQPQRPSTRHGRISLLSLERRETPAAFMAGNLVVVRLGTGATTPSNGTAVFLDEFQPNQVAGVPQTTTVQSIELPNNGFSPSLIMNGAATAEGSLSLSQDGKFLALAGYNVPLPFASSPANATSTAVPRAVAMLDSTGAFRISSFTDAYSGQGIRSAVTTDGISAFTVGAGANGVRYTARPTDITTSDVSTTISSFRGINTFGNQLYISTTSGTTYRLAAVGVGISTSPGQTLTNLPGFPTSGGGPNAFFFADIDGVPGNDTLYVADDAAGGGIQKYCLVGGSWTFKNTIPINICRSLAASVTGTDVTLFTTTGSTSTTLNSIVTITDSAGFNNNNNGTVITTIATVPAGSKSLYRGLAFVPQNSLLPTTLDALTASTTTTSGPSMSYTATFAAPVTGLTQSNFMLTTTGSATGAVGVPTGSGTTWTVPVNGISGGGTLRLDMVNTTGVAPPVVQLPTKGDVVTVSPLGTTLDVVAGKAIFSAALGKDNDVTLSLTAGNYTIKDTTDPINLTAAAVTAGWSVISNVPGNYTVSGPDAKTSALSIILGDGVDSLTLNDFADPLDAEATGIGSTANFQANVNLAGKVSLSGFDSITQLAGTTLTIGTLTLSGNTIGTALAPLHTKSATVSALSGGGGVYLLEDDGASFTLGATAFNPISVTSTSGLLSIDGKSTFAGGDVSLSSGDGIAINAALGDAMSAGNISIAANTDGVGNQGFTMGATGVISTTSTQFNAFTLSVNSAVGGAGDAALGTINIGSTGTLSVDANGGSIVSTGGTAQLFAGGGFNTLPGTINLKTSGLASAVGTAATRLSFRTGNVSVNAGTGGIYLVETSDQAVRFFQAVATGTGAVDIFTASGVENGIIISGPVTSGSGDIVIRSDDNLTVQNTGVIGGATFSGKILCIANFDGANGQFFIQDAAPGITVETTNTAADAVVINVSGSTVNNEFSGARLGNIKVGAGGGINITAGYAIGNPGTDPFRAGHIRMNDPAGKLDAGANGTVILNARDNPIGATGTPIVVIAKTIVANTNSTVSKVNTQQQAASIFVISEFAASFSGSTTTAKDASVERIGNIEFTTTNGDLMLNGDVTVDTGSITLTAAGDIIQTTGKVATTGALSAFPAGTLIRFATAGNAAGSLSLPFGKTLEVNGTLTVASPIGIDGTLRGSGTVSDVTVVNGGAVSPGSSPGVLATGNLVLNAGSTYSVELNGGVPGAGYDQLKVTGGVDLGGATLTGSLGFTPSSGQVFVIIDNDTNSDAVANTFDALIEGATVKIGGTDFTISYKGGDGNDVTLKAPGIAAAAKVSAVQINDGSVQRSRVTSLKVTFDQSVTFPVNPADAFQLKRQGTNAPVLLSGVQTGNSVTLSFTGGAIEFGSLVDGRFTLTVLAAQVNGGNFDGDGNGTPGDNYVLIGDPTVAPKLYRLFGDADADGDVDSSDFGAFRAVFGGTSSIFDFDNDGDVDTGDFGAFRVRFGSSV